jgi:hypothetical protein
VTFHQHARYEPEAEAEAEAEKGEKKWRSIANEFTPKSSLNNPFKYKIEVRANHLPPTRQVQNQWT